MKPRGETGEPANETGWNVRLLGRLEVASSSNEPVRFRSRTALSLLAFLSLNKTKEFSTDQLQELFWPESDGDRQAQNLRRAVADIRNVLEQDTPLGSVVVTRKNFVSLNPNRIATDVEKFLELTNPRVEDAEKDYCLSEALNLYFGPLLAPLSESWMLAQRMELEERFAQAVALSCQRRLDAGAVKEAIRIGRSGVLAAPYREDIHIALISAYRHAGMETEALRQYEELERLLDEEWGEPPSARARNALEGTLSKTQKDKVPTHAVITETEPAGGAVPLGSKFYVRRKADDEAETYIESGESVVLIQGPRQVGKSSLLARLLSHARTKESAIVFSDFQSMGESQLLDGNLFYKTLAHSLASQLRLELDIGRAWNDWLGSNMNLDSILGNLLEKCDGQVCWGMDEADLLFDRPYTNDFFGLLRSWHNMRALSPAGPWKKLTLVLTYATEAHLFITDLNQSPFNVGVRMALQDFTKDEMEELQSRYAGLPADAWRTIHDLTSGHPYLARRAFAFLSKGGSIDALESTASQADGPFGDHLQRVLVSIAQEPEMLAEVKRMLKGLAFENPTTRYRLWSAGVVSISNDGKPEFRVPVYEPFLRAQIG